ncbi:MAG TPA: hypothetical protein VK117_11690 [Pyrinomonadaceae bacterium]|nr:hypothetical protein [Pyrinomonadaceae bacterium]
MKNQAMFAERSQSHRLIIDKGQEFDQRLMVLLKVAIVQLTNSLASSVAQCNLLKA